jgi:hypothetical protein
VPASKNVFEAPRVSGFRPFCTRWSDQDKAFV